MSWPLSSEVRQSGRPLEVGDAVRFVSPLRLADVVALSLRCALVSLIDPYFGPPGNFARRPTTGAGFDRPVSPVQEVDPLRYGQLGLGDAICV